MKATYVGNTIREFFTDGVMVAEGGIFADGTIANNTHNTTDGNLFASGEIFGDGR